MKIGRRITLFLKPSGVAGVNEMSITLDDDEDKLGVKYALHYWFDSVEEIISYLEKTIALLKKVDIKKERIKLKG